MKFNISYPATGCQKLIDIDDDLKPRIFYDKRMGQEVDISSLGDEWKGYICKITGGNDKQGFPMKQGVLTNQRVRLLLSKGHSCYRQRRQGERKRKSVRGCIVDANLSVLALAIVQKGENEIPGLTDITLPRRLGPKRASKIRKLFNLSKEDDVRHYVVRRPMPEKEGKKPKTKAPKIQRLITPRILRRKRARFAVKINRKQASMKAAAEYAKLLATRQKEAKEKKDSDRRRKSSTSSAKKSESEAKPATKSAKSTKAEATAKTTKPTGKAGAAATAKTGKPVKSQPTTAKQAAASVKQPGQPPKRPATASKQTAAKTAGKGKPSAGAGKKLSKPAK